MYYLVDFTYGHLLDVSPIDWLNQLDISHEFDLDNLEASTS